MKSFIVSLCAFALLLALIICNYIFINRTADELEQLLLELEPEAIQGHNALNAYWERHRILMGFSVPNTEMQNFQERLTALLHAGSFRDPAEFERCRALALGALADLRRLERFSMENLL